MGATVGIGRGRDAADLFRTTFQDPFRDRVGAIIDPIGKAKASGSLTYEQVKAAQDQLEQEISDFSKNAETFKGLGGKNADVVTQAWGTLNPYIEQWRTGLASDLSTLPPPKETPPAPDSSGEAPTTGSILAPINQTAKGNAEAAAARQKKRATADYGRRQTFLGGDATYGTGRQPLKTLLGY